MATEILNPQGLPAQSKQTTDATAQHASQMHGPWFLTSDPNDTYLRGLAKITRENLVQIVAGEIIHLGVLTELPASAENDEIMGLEREMAHVRQELERTIGHILNNTEFKALVTSGKVRLYSVIETTDAGGMGRIVLPYSITIQDNQLQAVDTKIAIKLLFPNRLEAIDSEILTTKVPNVSQASFFVTSTFATQGVLCQLPDEKFAPTQGIFMERAVGPDGQTRECSKILSDWNADEYNPRFLCDMLLAAINGMAHIHNRGLTHGDPAEKQILTYTDAEGVTQFRVSDFGDLAKPIGIPVSTDRLAGSLENIDLRLALDIVRHSHSTIYTHLKKVTQQEEQYPFIFPLLRLLPSLRAILEETLNTEYEKPIEKFRAVSECIENIRKLIVNNKRKLINSYSQVYKCNEDMIEGLLDTIVIISSKRLKTRFDNLAPVRTAVEHLRQAILSDETIKHRNLLELIKSNLVSFPREEDINSALYTLIDNQNQTATGDTSHSQIINLDDLAGQELISEGVADGDVQNLRHNVVEKTGVSIDATNIDQASQAILAETRTSSSDTDLHHIEKIPGSSPPDATKPKQNWKWFCLNDSNLQYELVCESSSSSAQQPKLTKHSSRMPWIAGISLCGIVAATATYLYSSPNHDKETTVAAIPAPVQPAPKPKKASSKPTLSQATINEINNFKWSDVAEGAIQEFPLTTNDNQSYGTLYVKRGGKETNEYFQYSIKIGDSIRTYAATKIPKKTILGNLLALHADFQKPAELSSNCTYQEKELNPPAVTYFIRNGEVTADTTFVFPNCTSSGGISTDFSIKPQKDTAKPRQAICEKAKLAYSELKIDCAEATLGWRPITISTSSNQTTTIDSSITIIQATDDTPYVGSAPRATPMQTFTTTITTTASILGTKSDNSKSEAARIKHEITTFFSGTKQCQNGQNCTARLIINKDGKQFTTEIKKIGYDIWFNEENLGATTKSLESKIIAYIKEL